MASRNAAGGVADYKREALALFGVNHSAARREYVAARRAGNSRATARMMAEAMIE